MYQNLNLVNNLKYDSQLSHYQLKSKDMLNSEEDLGKLQNWMQSQFGICHSQLEDRSKMTPVFSNQPFLKDYTMSQKISSPHHYQNTGVIDNIGIVQVPKLNDVCTNLNRYVCTNSNIEYLKNGTDCTVNNKNVTMRMIDKSILFPKVLVEAESLNKCFTHSTESVVSEQGQDDINGLIKINVDRLNKCELDLSASNVSKNGYKIPSQMVTSNEQEIKWRSISEEVSDSFEHTLESKKSLFNNIREDLYYKSIVRDVRKYIQDQFTYFLNGMSKSQGVEQGLFMKKLNEFSYKFIPYGSSNTNLDMIMGTLGALIGYSAYNDHCDPYFKQISTNINTSLQKFTKIKLGYLIDQTGFKEIYKYYASHNGRESDYSRLRQHKTMKQNIKGYKYVFIDILKKGNK